MHECWELLFHSLPQGTQSLHDKHRRENQTLLFLPEMASLGFTAMKRTFCFLLPSHGCCYFKWTRNAFEFHPSKLPHFPCWAECSKNAVCQETAETLTWRFQREHLRRCRSQAQAPEAPGAFSSSWLYSSGDLSALSEQVSSLPFKKWPGYSSFSFYAWVQTVVLVGGMFVTFWKPVHPSCLN